MASRVLAFVAVLILLFAGAAAVDAIHGRTVRATGDGTTITNETWQPNEGNVTILDESNRGDAVYDRNVTVRQGGTVYAEAGNYSWIVSNGTIRTLNGTQLNTSQSATISYGYHTPTQGQQLTERVGAIPIRAGSAALLALAFSIAMLAAAAFLGRGI